MSPTLLLDPAAQNYDVKKSERERERASTYVSAITVRVWRERKGEEVGGGESESIIMERRVLE